MSQSTSILPSKYSRLKMPQWSLCARFRSELNFSNIFPTRLSIDATPQPPILSG